MTSTTTLGGGGPSLSEEDGAYCRAKGRLPLGEFPKALAATAREADQLAPSLGLLQGRRLKVADGSTLSMPDTPKNQKAYPPVHCPKPNFPMLRIVLLFSVLSGAVLSLVTAENKRTMRSMGKFGFEIGRAHV